MSAESITMGHQHVTVDAQQHTLLELETNGCLCGLSNREVACQGFVRHLGKVAWIHSFAVIIYQFSALIGVMKLKGVFAKAL